VPPVHSFPPDCTKIVPLEQIVSLEKNPLEEKKNKSYSIGSDPIFENEKMFHCNKLFRLNKMKKNMLLELPGEKRKKLDLKHDSGPMNHPPASGPCARALV
jgi:hypothetical protein